MYEKNLKLRSIESTHWLEIDGVNGLPVLIGINGSLNHPIRNINSKIEIEIDGKERRSPTGGLEYYETSTISNLEVTGKPLFYSFDNGTIWKVPVSNNDITGSFTYKLNNHGPAISIGLELNKSNHLVRNIVAGFDFQISESGWKVNLPGNGLRNNLEFSALTDSVGISPLGGLRGSASLVHLSNLKENIAIWTDNTIEIPEILFKTKGNDNFSIEVKSNFGSDLNEIVQIEVPILSIDLNTSDWENFPAIFQSWLLSKGISSPANPPRWSVGAMIFEAQIGFSVFEKINKYSPYPEVKDLIKDLDRIKSLGFSCIQLMPKQPYPSYNVHDYADIDVSYGNKKEMQELVEQAHLRGIKVILDVLLHGVLDKEIIKIAADGVRSGPFKEMIDEVTDDSFSADVKDWQNYLISWSRHIIDFEPYWSGGSPEKTSLEDKHPEWFYRDSNGEITGVYTKAFDARNNDWQSYFIDSMMNLVTELNIDGFRFDAPTYNDFYNWAPWARYRASASALACTSLFEKMRPLFKAANPDFLFYTEPSGLCLRKSMDVNYNYDEQWLVTSIGNPKSSKPWGVRNAKELAIWISERDSLLPLGSMTAHHIDSHDTFWWPSWGSKWRREQFDVETVRLLTMSFGSMPGPFMMFVGGETGIEDLLPKISQVKASETWIKGQKHWWISSETPEDIFGISSILDSQAVSVLVNYGFESAIFKPELNLVQPNIDFYVGTVPELGEKIMIPARSALVISHKILP